MDNDKRSELKVEVPRKKPKLKDTVVDISTEVLRNGAIEMARTLFNRLSRNPDDRNIELRIDIPKIQFGSQPIDETMVIDVDDWTEEETKELE
tara:strand:+ start:1937 stop:2215 length:279 start_codon:yes stop_codon:yes gene_type:complete